MDQPRSSKTEKLGFKFGAIFWAIGIYLLYNLYMRVQWGVWGQCTVGDFLFLLWHSIP